MLHFAKALVCLYVVTRFVLPLPWPRSVKIGLSIVLMVVFQHSLISLLVFGTMYSPEVPRETMIFANWLSGSVMLLAVFQLGLDIVTLIIAAGRRRRISTPLRLRYAMAAIAMPLAAFGVSQAILVPAVKDIEIAVQGLPREFDGYRMIHLTDLHISRLFQAPWVEKVVAKVNAQEADLVVITGDLIDGDLQARASDVAPLEGLRAKDGVFAVPGNHEYYYGRDEWLRKFEELGLRTISNGHVVLSRGSENLVLAGVNDLVASSFGLEGPDVGKALTGAPLAAPVILLSHQPRNAPTMSKAGVDLQLSGHTHGGMVVGLDRLVAIANNGFVSGLYEVEGMKLYVNNGTALWIGFALRLGVPSELTVITLRSA